MPKKVKKTNNHEETLAFAENIGANLKGGEIIELVSDVGGGKTTFTNGLVRNLNSKTKVTSPSFTICNEYKTTNFSVYHFDFYRLNAPGIIKKELQEAIDDEQAVVVVEWSGIVKDVMPSETIIIKITSVGDNERRFSINYEDKYKYLFN